MCFVPSVSTHEAGVSLWLPLPSQRKGGWLLLSLTSQHTNMILHNRCKKTSILCQIGCFTKGEICLCLSLSFFRKCHFSQKITGLTHYKEFLSKIQYSISMLLPWQAYRSPTAFLQIPSFDLDGARPARAAAIQSH